MGQFFRFLFCLLCTAIGNTPSTEAQILLGTLRLLPGEHYSYYFHTYRLSETVDPRMFAYVVPPGQNWLVGIAPDIDTSDNCFDLCPFRFDLVAPMTTGTYMTTLVDQTLDESTPGASDLNFSLWVSNNIVIDTTWNLVATPGQVLDLPRIVKWNYKQPLTSCVEYYLPPDSMQKISFHNYDAAATWLDFPSDTFDIKFGNSIVMPITITAPTVLGNYKTVLSRYSEYRSLPYRIEIRLRVATVSGTVVPEPVLNDVRLFPNPAAPDEPVWLAMESREADDVRLEWFDALGRRVGGELRHLPAGQTKWSPTTLTNLSSGLYHYLLTTSDGERAQGSLVIRQ